MAESAPAPAPAAALTSADLTHALGLRAFTSTSVLSSSTLSGSISVLGTLHDRPAILVLQRTVLEPTVESVTRLLEGVGRCEVFLENAPYFSAHAWSLPSPSPAPTSVPDVQIKIICPATDTHIRKYTAQTSDLFCETPQVYQEVVKPYIESFSVDRLEWVYAILQGRKEADRVLYRLQHPEEGFVITPDLKWDQTSMEAVYLTVLIETRSIYTLRDLTRDHLPLLRNIRRQAMRVAKERYGVKGSQLRLFVHYQPTYYHFHIHVVHMAHEPFAGMLAGQAHMLDDIISLLELSPLQGPSILARKTFTYPLGAEHGLYEQLVRAGALVAEPLSESDTELIL